jgi:hypothetical protein
MLRTSRAFIAVICLATFALLAGPLVAAAQAPQSAEPQATQQPQQAPQQSQPAPQQSQPAQQAPAQKAETAKGELISVDPKANTFSLKPAEGAEMRFEYNDQTKVTGAQGGVAGLATMSGRQLTVQYTSKGTSRLATAIEFAPQAGQQPRPQQPGADQARPQQPGSDPAPARPPTGGQPEPGR